VKEHDQGLLYLGQLSEAVEDIRSHGFSVAAFIRIGEAIAFIDTTIRRHNEKEEEILLPLIGRHLPDSPREIRREHRALWAVFAELRKHVQDIEDGRLRGSAITDLMQSACAVVEVLRDHIIKENEELFPAAKVLLTGEEYRELAEGIARASESTSIASR
jgi:hemerythrin-like domain-containing protein